MENIGFTGINYEWFIGQVPPNQTLDKTNVDGWGDRVKVRIIGRHNKSGSITPDEKLPWAIVERPTSQGNASRGSTGLTGGEWVRGYYLDPFKQVPVIVSVLARGTYENNVPLTVVKERKSTEFENVTRYNAFGPHAGQRLGADKPEQSASIAPDSQPTRKEFEDAKKIPQDQKDIQNNKEKAATETKTKTETTTPVSTSTASRVDSTARVGSPENPVSNSSSLTSTLSSNTNQQSVRTNVAPTREQLDIANKKGLRFVPYRPGSEAAANNPGGGIFKNSTLE